MAVPALLALIIWVALSRRKRSRLAALIATATVVTLAAFNILAMFSIGIFILPATVLAAWAVWAGPSGAPARAHRPPAAA